MGRLCPNICHRSATWLCKLVSSLTFRPQSKACHRSHTNVITAIHSLWYITCCVGEGLCYLCRRRYYIPRHWQITTFKNMTNSLQKTILSTPKRAPDQSSYTISLPCFLCCSGLFSAVGTINRAVSERWWVFWSRSKGAGWGRTLPTWALQRPHQWSLAFKERVRGGATHYATESYAHPTAAALLHSSLAILTPRPTILVTMSLFSLSMLHPSFGGIHTRSSVGWGIFKSCFGGLRWRSDERELDCVGVGFFP